MEKKSLYRQIKREKEKKPFFLLLSMRWIEKCCTQNRDIHKTKGTILKTKKQKTENEYSLK